MRFTKTASYDNDLVLSFQKYLTASEEISQSDKLKKAVSLLSEACGLITDIDGCDKVCKKIEKAISKLGKCADKLDIVIDVNSSDEIEKDVQKDIENQ